MVFKKHIIVFMKKLDDIANILVGYQPKTRVQETANGSFYLIQGKDFDESGDLKKENLLLITPERNIKSQLICDDDILFQARGFNHFAYYPKQKLTNTLASASFYILRLKTDEIIPEYLAWLLNQKSAQNYFNANASRTAISFLSKKTLSELKIKTPSIETQKKIGKVVKSQKHVYRLQKELTKKRSQIINQLCLNAAQQEENL